MNQERFFLLESIDQYPGTPSRIIWHENEQRARMATCAYLALHREDMASAAVHIGKCEYNNKHQTTCVEIFPSALTKSLDAKSIQVEFRGVVYNLTREVPIKLIKK